MYLFFSFLIGRYNHNYGQAVLKDEMAAAPNCVPVPIGDMSQQFPMAHCARYFTLSYCYI